MKAMKDFFKNEGAYIEYTLLYGSGEQRTNILGITAKHYCDKAAANSWALAITSKISDEDALAEVLRIYRRMVGDINAELPTKEDKAEETKESIGNPVVYMIKNGEEALKGQLESMDLEELKSLVKTYHLDTARSYSRSNKPERIRQGILSRAVTRATQGNTFFNYEN